MKLRATALLTTCAIGASLALSSFILTSPGAHGAPQQCSVKNLSGRYVFSGQGTHLHEGAFSFDGNGTFTGKQTSVRETNLAQRETLHGTYTLDADCTGAMVIEGQLGGTAHWDIFVTEDGKKGRMVRTDAGTTGVRDFVQ
jgi:hypothetical protein